MDWHSPPEDVIRTRVDLFRRVERHFEQHLRKTHRAMACDEFTVADMRVVHELGMSEGGGCGAWLADRLGLDTGYLCRILGKLEAYGVVSSRASPLDGRMRDWNLTTWGRAIAARLEDGCRERVRAALLDLHPGDQRRVAQAMATIEEMLVRAEMRRVPR